jgi:cytochrome bd-type quinol oxidase subunit 2
MEMAAEPTLLTVGAAFFFVLVVVSAIWAWRGLHKRRNRQFGS